MALFLLRSSASVDIQMHGKVTARQKFFSAPGAELRMVSSPGSRSARQFEGFDLDGQLGRENQGRYLEFHL